MTKLPRINFSFKIFFNVFPYKEYGRIADNLYPSHNIMFYSIFSYFKEKYFFFYKKKAKHIFLSARWLFIRIVFLLYRSKKKNVIFLNNN